MKLYTSRILCKPTRGKGLVQPSCHANVAPFGMANNDRYQMRQLGPAEAHLMQASLQDVRPEFGIRLF